MGQTMVEKIVSRQVGRPVQIGEKIERLPITKLFFNDVIGPPAIENFMADFGDLYEQAGKPTQVFDPKRVFFLPDHSVPTFSIHIAEGVKLMQSFSKERGIKCYKEGDGIEHVVLIEDGQIVPWDIVLGTDSHTDTNGAMGSLAFGVGTTDAEYAMATGHLYDFVVPESVKFELTGALPKGVFSKDIILHIIGMMGAGGCSKRVAEFTGPGVRSLSMDARTTMCNMAVEMSARTGIMAFDDTLADFLKDRAEWPVDPIDSDPDATYAETYTVDLSALEPTVAFPHKPANTTPISKLQEMIQRSQSDPTPDFVPVDDDTITDAFWLLHQRALRRSRRRRQGDERPQGAPGGESDRHSGEPQGVRAGHGRGSVASLCKGGGQRRIVELRTVFRQPHGGDVRQVEDDQHQQPQLQRPHGFARHAHLPGQSGHSDRERH